MNRPRQPVPGRQLYLTVDFRLGLMHDALDVATERIEADVDSALQAFTADQCRAFAQFHLGDVTWSGISAPAAVVRRILPMVSTLSRYCSGNEE